MRHASYHATGFFIGSSSAKRSATQGRLFAALLSALHRSRQLQMQRVLRQYDHLIERAERREARELEASKSEMACALKIGSRDNVSE
jgi:hypothetical protein